MNPLPTTFLPHLSEIRRLVQELLELVISESQLLEEDRRHLRANRARHWVAECDRFREVNFTFTRAMAAEPTGGRHVMLHLIQARALSWLEAIDPSGPPPSFDAREECILYGMGLLELLDTYIARCTKPAPDERSDADVVQPSAHAADLACAKLPDLHLKLLRTLIGEGWDSEKRSATREGVAAAAGVKSDSCKDAFNWLSREGYTQTKRGRGGYTYISAKGIQAVRRVGAPLTYGDGRG